MILAFRVLASTVRQVYVHAGTCFMANVTATALSIPLLVVCGAVSYRLRSFGLIPVLVALTAGILPNPVCGGVQAIAREMVQGESPLLSIHWTGLRETWRLALRCWLTALLVTAVIVLNISFYTRGGGALSLVLGLIWLYVLVTWLALHLYVFPLIFQQEVKRVLYVYRNAVILTMSRPIFSLALTVAWIAMLLVASATGLVVIIGLAVGCLIQQQAFIRVLPTVSARSDPRY